MREVSRTLILLLLLMLVLLALVLLVSDVHTTLYEDGSIRMTMCIPLMLCSKPYVEPISTIPPPDYGRIILPEVHY